MDFFLRFFYIDKKMNFGQLFDKLFSVLIEPQLIQPTIVFDYPKSISPLAKVHRDNDLLVERFELFIAGMEFANAFSTIAIKSGSLKSCLVAACSFSPHSCSA